MEEYNNFEAKNDREEFKKFIDDGINDIMYDDFNSSVIVDTKEQIEMILGKLKNVRENNDYKGYKSLTDSLDSLLVMFSDRSREEVILSYFGKILASFTHEARLLKDKLKKELEDDNYRVHREWSVSYKRMVNMTDWVRKFIDNIEGNKIRSTSLPQNRNK